MTLKKLTIEYLRGSVSPFELPFEKGKKLTVVYGENGTGKSTICDAFEFLGKGNVGSLDGRGLGATNRFWPSLGKGPEDINVELESASGPCGAKMVKSKVHVHPPDKRPKVEVLRRSQILNLIEETPAKRYEAIRRFIDVSGIESSEETLRKLIRDTETGRDIAVARVQENKDSILQFWEAAGKPGAKALTWAEAETALDANVFDDEIVAINELQRSYEKLLDYPDQLNRAEIQVTEAGEALANAEQDLSQHLNKAAHDAAELIHILQAAKSYLVKHASPATCPLCESDEKIEGLSIRVDRRIADMATLQTASREKANRETSLLNAKQNLQLVKDNAAKHAKEFGTCVIKYKWPRDVVLPEHPIPEDVNLWSAWLTQNANLAGTWKKAETSRQDKKQFISTLKSALATYRENVGDQKELEKLIPRLVQTLEIVQEERRKFTDSILSQISTEVGRLYEQVHPGEGLNKISLELDPKKRASLEIGASFCGQATPPQAYFSDSHLDTLGLCVFLALSALEKPEQTILVLDDVLASVDEPHVERLIEMLYQEAVKFRHCIITTHYRPWKTKLRWGWLKNGQCQFVELTKWTPANGLALIRSIPDVERLRVLLSETPADPQLVCAKAGVILEAALDFLTLQYECSVPRRISGAYTLGELLPAIDRKLRQSLIVEVHNGASNPDEVTYSTVPLAPYLDELTRIAQVRNVFGCHFNQLSFDLLEDDALLFGQQVLGLIEALVDHQSGWPKNDKSGCYWATSGETRRLLPLKRPR